MILLIGNTLGRQAHPFASLCVFISSQIDDSNHEKNDLTEYVYKYLDSLINRETGAYFSGIIPNENEVINGAMKVYHRIRLD